MMKSLSVIAFALTMTALPALARTTNPKLSIPSAQNSGAGIPGLSGTEDGRAVQPGPGATARRYSFAIRDQDAAGIRGLPGAEAGSAVKPPSQLS